MKGTRPVPVHRPGSKLAGIDRLLVTDVDDTLTGDDEALATLLLERLEERRRPKSALALPPGAP